MPATTDTARRVLRRDLRARAIADHPCEDPSRTAMDPTLAYCTQRFPRGVELFTQGEMLQDVLQIVGGIVKLTQSDATGTQSITGLALAGEWLGTASVIATERTPVSAITCSNAAVRRIPATRFKAALLHDLQLSLQIHQAHSRELCRQSTWIGQMCSLPSLQRLQCILCRIAAMYSVRAGGSAIKLQLPLHQWELAEFIGVTPEYLSRLMANMEADHLIRREQGWIVIPDPQRLCDEDRWSSNREGC